MQLHHAETMYGNYRIHALSASQDRAMDLVKRGIEFHANQNSRSDTVKPYGGITCCGITLDMCYRDYQVIVDAKEIDELKALTKRLDDLWEGSCNHPCDRMNLQKADSDELRRFANAIRRAHGVQGFDLSGVKSIDSLAISLYFQGVRA